MPYKLQALIYPPKGYYADEANSFENHIRITYRNAYDQVNHIIYSSAPFIHS